MSFAFLITVDNSVRLNLYPNDSLKQSDSSKSTIVHLTVGVYDSIIDILVRSNYRKLFAGFCLACNLNQENTV